MLQRLLLLVIQFGLATTPALAEPAKLAGEALRQAVSGKAVLIEASIGSFLVRYENDGTMTGQALTLVASLGSEKNRGNGGGVADDRLCQRWYRWLDAKQYCVRLQRAGAAVHWLRDDGLFRYGHHSRAPVTRLQ